MPAIKKASVGFWSCSTIVLAIVMVKSMILLPLDVSCGDTRAAS
jgi:hypothetical protein